MYQLLLYCSTHISYEMFYLLCLGFADMRSLRETEVFFKVSILFKYCQLLLLLFYILRIIIIITIINI